MEEKMKNIITLYWQIQSSKWIELIVSCRCISRMTYNGISILNILGSSVYLTFNAYVVCMLVVMSVACQD